MFTTSLDLTSGRVIVSDDSIDDNSPQNFTVCVKDESDWEEIHNYIINVNEIDGIPNRKIDCTSDMKCSPKRGVYEMSVMEAHILRNNPKVEWVEQSSLYNPIVLEQRKYDEEFDKHCFADRFRDPTIDHLRPNSSTTQYGSLDYTQWGIIRHGHLENVFGANTTIQSDLQFSLSGKNVDVVIMDSGVKWNHPEFLKPGVSSFVNKDSTRVRDILIHGASEYGINWSSEGLVAPGSGTLANYTETGALGTGIDQTTSSDMHGSHVAGIAAGNQFGTAFEANIWSIACVDRSDLGWSEPSDGFDYIKVWHKNKPINPLTGRKNPTVVNCSWGHRNFVSSMYSQPHDISFRGVTYSYSQWFQGYPNSQVPAFYHAAPQNGFTTRKVTGQTEANEIANDSDCDDITFVCAAGNSAHKQEVIDGVDFDNASLTSGRLVYSSGYDAYYNRLGTPAITKQGQPDAFIVVGSMDSQRMSGSQERCSSFSNRGPAVDVFSAGSTVLAPWRSFGGWADPRDNNFYIGQINGTSMASPQVCGVIANYLQSNPSADRVTTRKWLFEEGSVTLSPSEYYDAYQSNTRTDTNYWGYHPTDTAVRHSLKSSERRILYNPYANNRKSAISGVKLSGISVQKP